VTNPVTRRLATVTAIASGVVTVAIGGDTTNVTAGIPVLATVGPLAVGDPVLVDLWAESAVIVDRINGGTAVPVTFNSLSSPTGTTASTTAATLSTPGTFIKWGALTDVRVQMFASNFVNVANTEITYAVGLGGVDNDIFAIYNNVISSHISGSGIRYLTGFAAGSYSVTVRWRRTVGTGTATRDADDYLSLDVREVT
jgi:hypothetical protein